MNRDTFDMFEEKDRGRFGDNEAAPARQPRVTGASDLIDLTLVMHVETKKGQKNLGLSACLSRVTTTKQNGWQNRWLNSRRPVTAKDRDRALPARSSP